MIHFCYLIFIFFLLFISNNLLFAYKGGSHVLLVRHVLNSIEKEENKYYVVLKPYRPDESDSYVEEQQVKLEIKDPELVEILADEKYRPFFYAGALGPDSFPDIISGQIQIHVNRGQELELSKIENNVSMEKRSIDQWRSIDYGMFLIDSAKKYNNPGSSKRYEALAFTYGYLFHMLQDANEHDVINSFTGLPFTLTDGEGVFGGASPALQHIALEVSHLHQHVIAAKRDDKDNKFINDIVTDKKTISIPFDFLRSVYTSSSHSENEGGRFIPSGAVGGEFIQYLTQVKNILLAIKDPKIMDGLTSEMIADIVRNDIPDKVIDVFIDKKSDSKKKLINKKITERSESCYKCFKYVRKSFGTFYNINQKNKITAVPLEKADEIAKNSLDLRINFIDIMIDNWIKLSECVAKNILKGDMAIDSKKDKDLIKDSCRETDFIFQDNAFVSKKELTKILYSENDQTTSPADIGYNVKKILGLMKIILAQLSPFNQIVLQDFYPLLPKEFIDFYNYCNCEEEYEKSNIGQRVSPSEFSNLISNFCKIFIELKKIKNRVNEIKKDIEKRLVMGLLSPLADEIIKRTNLDELANTLKLPAETLTNVFYLDQDLKGNPNYLVEIIDNIGPCGEARKSHYERPQIVTEKSCVENANEFINYRKDEAIDCIMQIKFRNKKTETVDQQDVLENPIKAIDPKLNKISNNVRENIFHSFTITDRKKAEEVWQSLITASVCYVQEEKNTQFDKIFDKKYMGFHLKDKHSHMITLLGELFFKKSEVKGPVLKKWLDVANSNLIDNNANNLTRMALGHDVNEFRNTLRSLDDPNGVGKNAGENAQFFPWSSPTISVNEGEVVRKSDPHLKKVSHVPLFNANLKVEELFYVKKVFSDPRELF